MCVIYLFIYIYIYICVCVCVCVEIYIYIYTHTHTQHAHAVSFLPSEDMWGREGERERASERAGFVVFHC